MCRVFFINRLAGKFGQKPRGRQGFFDDLNLFVFASILHVFAVMAVKRISINWVAKLNDSKDWAGSWLTACWPGMSDSKTRPAPSFFGCDPIPAKNSSKQTVDTWPLGRYVSGPFRE
jgi:hypothetical protein